MFHTLLYIVFFTFRLFAFYLLPFTFYLSIVPDTPMLSARTPQGGFSLSMRNLNVLTAGKSSSILRLIL